jgi:hypothetical protein
MEGESLQTTTGVPMDGRAVALGVGVVSAVVVLLETYDHAVATERPKTTHVGVVGGAHDREALVVRVLITVDLLPTPIGIGCEGVIDPGEGFETHQVEIENTGKDPDSGAAGDLEESTSGYTRVVLRSETV